MSDCTIDGCGKPMKGAGLCSMHAARKARHGDPTYERPKAAPALNTSGYLKVSMPGHPTADANRAVYVHRAVLYDAIGAGEHACHWCATPLEWFGIGRRELVVDHVNEVKTDNRVGNLVPSCNRCNVTRVLHAKLRRTECQHGHAYTPENTRIGDRGKRVCITCRRATQNRYAARKRAAA